MGIKEYGQAASEVELQDNPGPIKNQEGEAVIDITNDQDVGIGTSTPRRKLDILDASNPQLRLSRADNSDYVDLGVTSNANLLTEGATSNFYNIVRGSVAAYSIYQNNTTGDADGSGKGLEVGTTNNSAFIRSYGSGSNGTLNIGAGGSGGLTFSTTNDITVLAGYLALESEETTPSTPADGDGGILYVKSDGKLYFLSHETAETDLTSGGGGGLTYENKTSTFTAEGNYFYTVSTSGGDVTVNLPAAAGVAGKTVDVCHKTTGNTITIDGNSDERINGATTLTLSGIAYQNVTLFCTGTEWIIR